jgi:hypothetical protein
MPRDNGPPQFLTLRRFLPKRERIGPIIARFATQTTAAAKPKWGSICIRAPNLRKRDTQELTDGELFYIIQNGIRLSGMPAWGARHSDEEYSWKLVRFIRHLPNLSEAEIQEMEKLNPKSPAEWEEQQQEEQFLKGQQPGKPSTSDHHPH